MRARGGCAAHATERGYSQAEFKTFCSFDINSRGSLRTEITPAPAPGLRPDSIPHGPRLSPQAESPALIFAAAHFLGFCFPFPLLQVESSFAQGFGPHHTPAEVLNGIKVPGPVQGILSP